MSDFIIQFGDGVAAEKISRMLTQSSYLSGRAVNIEDYSWGKVYLLQAPGNLCNIDRHGDEIFGFLGRPRFTGDGPNMLGNESYFKRLRENWGNTEKLSKQLTGMYCLLHCRADGVEVITDLMGAQPVYEARAPSGKLVAIGTNVEVLAVIADRVNDFDTTSLAELLIYSNITFPFSSRNGITEFEPACHITIARNPNDHSWEPQQEVFWQPVEEILDDNPEERIEDLVTRMRIAGDDISSSVKNIGLTLSGGLDSRAILTVLPAEQVTAITYVTHENFETDTARMVAAAYGCRHIFARRPEDFFSRILLEHGPSLMGMERRAMVHGLCMVDAGVSDDFDVILGGQLSDTYLKHHYMPKWQREIYRPKGVKEKTMRQIRKILNIPQPVAVPGILSVMGRYLLTRYLSEDSRTAVEKRRNARLEVVRKIRPQTCEEWVRFWPTSRQDDLSHVMGNNKLLNFETLFSHRQVIEFATTMSPAQRYDGCIANEAFNRLYGRDLVKIRDANTGFAPGKNRGRRSVPGKEVPEDKGIETRPWNNVATSWFDLVMLQKDDEQWQDLRMNLSDSGAFDILLPLLDPTVRDISRAYQDSLGPTFNQMFIQLGVCISRL